jgi:hypothetical protein
MNVTMRLDGGPAALETFKFNTEAYATMSSASPSPLVVAGVVVQDID